MKNIVEINNLNKTYHSITGELLTIKDFSLNVKEGEFVSILGTSGCGKSTILNILAGLDNNYKGEIKYNKDNIVIGYMLQDDSLFEWLTVLDNALLGLKIQKKLNKNNIDYVKNLLYKYGLKDFLYKHPSSLSGGMRQRVALIRTLAIKPDILLLDEPFSKLDYLTRLEVSDDVYNIIKNENKTVIMVSHDLAEAISMSEKVVIISKRPGTIKNIYEINLTDKRNPIHNRKAKEFAYYYELFWKELSSNV